MGKYIAQTKKRKKILLSIFEVYGLGGKFFISVFQCLRVASRRIKIILKENWESVIKSSIFYIWFDTENCCFGG